MPLKKIIALAVVPLLLASCGKGKKTEEEIARVNDAPILLKDFQREVTLASKRDPTLALTPENVEKVLDSVIDRKLLIQEAVKKGLSEDERFIATIKAYWEQTLIRELIDAKTKEWAEVIFVTEDEARRHYDRMRWRVTLRTASAQTEEDARRLSEGLAKGGKAPGGDTTGLLIEDIQPESPLAGAFDLKAGETGVFKGPEGFTAAYVVAREAVPVPDYDEVKVGIKAHLLDHKKEKALEEWLSGVRGSSTIVVDKNLLKRMAHE